MLRRRHRGAAARALLLISPCLLVLLPLAGPASAVSGQAASAPVGAGSVAAVTPTVEVRVHPVGLVTRYSARLEVSYRCSWPDGDFGFLTEVYSTLRQVSGQGRETSHERLDRDEFWCDGRWTTVPQIYSADVGRFHGGPATLSLHVILCEGDDAGGETCATEDFEADLRLRGGRPPQE